MTTKELPLTTSVAAAPPAARRPASSSKARTLLPLVLEVGVPAAAYYVLHALGASDVVALTVGAALPGLRVLATVVRKHRLDAVGLFVCLMFALGAGLVFVTGDARLVLAKQAAFVLLAGLVCAFSLFRRPVILFVARPMATHGDPRLESLWDASWTTSTAFRHAVRASTAAFAIALVLDAIGRIVVVYTVPVSEAVLLANAPGLVAIVAALFFHLRHTKPVFEAVVAEAGV